MLDKLDAALRFQQEALNLRALVRQARKDAQAQPADRPGAASRHGRAYRELFQLIRAALAPDASDTDDEADPQDTLA